MLPWNLNTQRFVFPPGGKFAPPKPHPWFSVIGFGIQTRDRGRTQSKPCSAPRGAHSVLSSQPALDQVDQPHCLQWFALLGFTPETGFSLHLRRCQQHPWGTWFCLIRKLMSVLVQMLAFPNMCLLPLQVGDIKRRGTCW